MVSLLGSETGRENNNANDKLNDKSDIFYDKFENGEEAATGVLEEKQPFNSLGHKYPYEREIIPDMKNINENPVIAYDTLAGPDSIHPSFESVSGCNSCVGTLTIPVDKKPDDTIFHHFLSKFPYIDHRMRNMLQKNNPEFHSEILGINIAGNIRADISYNTSAAADDNHCETRMCVDGLQTSKKHMEKVLINMRENAVKHLAALNKKKKLNENLGDEIQKYFSQTKYVFQFKNFCADLESFIFLVINVEYRWFHIKESDGKNFLKLKLKNQLEDIKSLKMWIDERQRVITDKVLSDDQKDTIRCFIENKKKIVVGLALVMDEIKTLDNLSMLINFVI